MMDRETFRHWHKPGAEASQLDIPPSCCAGEFKHLLDAIEREHGTALDESVHGERRRVILNALHAVGTFGENVAVALTGREKELAELLTKHAANVIRKTGCICPRIDTTTFGGRPSWTPGYDPRCGMHERPATP